MYGECDSRFLTRLLLGQTALERTTAPRVFHFVGEEQVLRICSTTTPLALSLHAGANPDRFCQRKSMLQSKDNAMRESLNLSPNLSLNLSPNLSLNLSNLRGL